MTTLVLVPAAHNFDTSAAKDSITLELLGYPLCRQVEATGRGFHDFAVVQHLPVANDAVIAKTENASKKSKRSTLKEAGVKNQEFDFYDIMGLNDIGPAATQEQIKSYYKTACLVHHPDKNMKNGVADDTKFKQLQLAFDNLSNPKKKIAYDSSYYFDDSIPTIDGTDESEFYETMGPAFESWKMWSTQQLPSLGDENTKFADVENFYNKWTLYKSWRDFSFLDEHNLDDADNRDERRWMEKQNEKIKSQHKVDERKTLFKLIETSKQYDPRILKRKQQNIENQKKKEEKKEQEKIKKQALLEKKKEEERIAAQLEKKRILEEKMKKKEQKVVVQATNDVMKNSFRNLCGKHMVMTQFLSPKQVGLKLLAEHVEYIIMRADVAELEQIYKDLEPLKDEASAFIKLFDEKRENLRLGIRSSLVQAQIENKA